MSRSYLFLGFATPNAGSRCFLLGAVGLGAWSGWRVPGEDYLSP